MADAKVVVPQLAFTGDRLRATRTREEPVSPLQGILDPQPHLHAVFGEQKTGKTSFTVWIAQRWALGVSPWEGAPALPGSRVLILSREQTVRRIDELMVRLGDGAQWEDRTLIVARDPDLDRRAEDLLRLDGRGQRLLRSLLKKAKEEGDPIGLIVLDSLSRLKPPSVEENDNDKMTGWLDQLEEIAVEHAVWILLIHHTGHRQGKKRQDARNAGRGASAIGAVPAGLLLLERVPYNPRRRRLKVDGNYVLADEIEFEVSGEDDPASAIRYFREVVSAKEAPPGKFLDPGEEITTFELARRLANVTGTEKPPGSAQSRAKLLRDEWESAGSIEVSPGKRGAKMIRLRDVSTPPQPHLSPPEKSDHPHHPTTPIGVGGGGEVVDGPWKEGTPASEETEAKELPQTRSNPAEAASSWMRRAYEYGKR